MERIITATLHGKQVEAKLLDEVKFLTRNATGYEIKTARELDIVGQITKELEILNRK